MSQSSEAERTSAWKEVFKIVPAHRMYTEVEAKEIMQRNAKMVSDENRRMQEIRRKIEDRREALALGVPLDELL